MKKSAIITISIICLSAIQIQSQTLNQTIKGRVLDKASQISLPGATIFIEGTNPLIGGTSDLDGYFRLENVPVGRYNIVVSYVGYQSITIPEVMVNSGKEKVLSIELVESINKLDEVVVKAHVNKNQPLNPLASISARSFSVEETRRYAGGYDDPSRMASAFAGVTTTHMGDNSIIIRGNAPKGVLWRLEGVEIPNPSHFSGISIQGGGFTTIFSSQVLTNSDFFTGAFPAEYGNALAGVFDMKLRTGNMDKHEHAIQIGTLGVDFSSEGPFVKGKKATYLFNYRYVNFAILGDALDAIPKYQDASFKINFPTSKAGTFALWGIAGFDNLTQEAKKDSLIWEKKEHREEQILKMIPGAMGISHKYIANQKTYFNSSVSTTLYQQLFDSKWLGKNMVLRDSEYINIKNQKYVFSTFVNHKFGVRHTNRTGINYYHMLFNEVLRYSPDFISPMKEYVNEKGNSGLFQAFSQSKYYINENLTVNAGMHAQYFLLNKNFSIEPRMSVKYNMNSKHSVTFGYGRHSQLEDIKIYLSKQITPNGIVQPNKNLDFSKADHFVVGYDFLIHKNLRMKIEPYYQNLSNIPVIPDSSYSISNLKQDWFFNDSLSNEGAGTNMGIDFTLEKFLSNNYYWMVTGSIFNSKYKGGDGIERNSIYNRNFNINGLFGKEFYVGHNKNNILGINIKATLLGGEYHAPVLMEESLLAQSVIYDYSKPNTVKDPNQYYIDLTITFTKNKPKYTSTWALQLKNITSSPSKFEYSYNYKDKLENDNLDPVVPSLSYKIEF